MNKSILNFSMIAAYTTMLLALCAVFELALFDVPAPNGLIRISEGLAEVGFSVTVIAISILAVITSMSERRFFGIKAGEYLKFRRRKLTPGFYDLLIIIVLIGAFQYVALAFDLRFAAAFLFIEIIALLIIELRWGLGIAFFYYGKEKEIRSFIVDEIKDNLSVVGKPDARKKKKERSELAVTSRINNLFAHTKNAVSVNDIAVVEQNLSLMAYLFARLLDDKYHTVWHNYETRMDRLFSSILPDYELSEFAVNSLVKMTDDILATKESGDKQIAKNCDFDSTRIESYKMVAYSPVRLLQNMFDKQIFYRLAAVKIYGIKDMNRKVSRYALYAGQFAESFGSSKHKEELLPMLEGSLKKLVQHCFENGKFTNAAIYFCLIVSALQKQGMALNGLWEEPKNQEENNETHDKNMCMLKSLLGFENCGELSEQETKTSDEFKRLLDTHK